LRIFGSAAGAFLAGAAGLAGACSLARPLAFGELSPDVCSTIPLTIELPADATALPMMMPPVVPAGSASTAAF